MNRRANGASIFAIRQAMGIRQGALAARCGIDPGYLSRIENKGQQPAPEIISRLAAELGVSVEAISYVVPEPEQATA